MTQPLYTEFAARGFDLSKTFALFCATPPLPCETGVYAIELSTPHGPSTGRGEQSRLHVTLVHGERVLTVGAVDLVAQTISLRGYDYLDAQHMRRWKTALPFARGAYDAFVQRVTAFARSQQLALVINELAEPDESGARRSSMFWLAAIAAGVVGVAAALAIAHVL